MADLINLAGLIRALNSAKMSLSQSDKFGERLYFLLTVINCLRSKRFFAISALVPLGLQSIANSRIK